MRVLGVDPGSRITGYGVVEEQNNEISFIAAGLIKPPEKLPFPQKIHRIFQGLVEIIVRYAPHAIAVEDLFHAKKRQELSQAGTCPRRRLDCCGAAGYSGF